MAAAVIFGGLLSYPTKGALHLAQGRPQRTRE